ncbi:MAG: tetratricopeptide repeat protein [Gemmatimonadetes bacterium]|nr:tetratricopeptide repeat protein [Gemmatimonadota bacterium]MYB55466.1 tetratricopeptide repeat protein [Gemmatimonadota bacterium]
MKKIRLIAILVIGVLFFCNALDIFSAPVSENPDSIRQLLTQPYQIKQLLSNSDRLFKSGDYDGAISGYKKVIALDSLSFHAWYNQGRASVAIMNDEQALACFTKAVAIEPENVSALNGRGTAYFNLQLYQNAMEDFKRCIILDSQYYVAHYMLGRVWGRLENFKQALISYQFAARINAEPQELWYNIGCVLSYLGRYKDAIEQFDKAMHLNPIYEKYKPDDIWLEKGYALRKLEQFAEAEIYYMKVLEINKSQINENRAVSYYNLACIYSLQKLWERSFESLKQSLEIAPNYALDVQSDEDLEGLVTHPIYSSKVKDLVAKHSEVKE